MNSCVQHDRALGIIQRCEIGYESIKDKRNLNRTPAGKDHLADLFNLILISVANGDASAKTIRQNV